MSNRITIQAAIVQHAKQGKDGCLVASSNERFLMLALFAWVEMFGWAIAIFWCGFVGFIWVGE